MIEMKITVDLPGMPEAIKALADAISHSCTAPSMSIRNSGLNINTAHVSSNESPTDQTVDATSNVQVAQADNAKPTTGNVIPMSKPKESAKAQEENRATATQAEVVPSLDDISRAGAALIDAGKMDAVLSLCDKYGIQMLTDIPKDKYAAFACDLRALGASI